MCWIQVTICYVYIYYGYIILNIFVFLFNKHNTIFIQSIILITYYNQRKVKIAKQNYKKNAKI